jgi:ABC-2 type transport system permease protein
MTGALLYLRLKSLQNLLWSRLRRLQQPKYLVGFIVGAGYFYLMVFRHVRPGGRPSASLSHLPAVLPADLIPTVTALGALILLVIVLLAWLVPDRQAGLAFSEAEIAFLFPAPVRRRTLIYYKLLNSQFAILVTAALITLVTGSWSFLGGNTLIHGIGWWVILATLNLHFMGSSFAMTRLLDRGVTPWRRRFALLGLIAGFLVVTVVWLGRDLHAPQPADLVSVHTIAAYLNTLLGSGPLPWLLLPGKLVLGPFLASDARALVLALGPALLIFALHVVWVLRSEVSFEDASIARSEKRAAKVAAVREGNWRAARGALKARPGPFRLAATGRPEVAFLWKNLLSTFPVFRPRTFAYLACLIVAAYQWLARDPAYRLALPVFAVVAFVAAGYILFLGPQLARQDLRSDLANTDLLKTYPLHGWQVVLGQLLTPVAILTGALWLVLLTLLLAFHPARLDWLTPALRLTIGAALVPILPVVCALQLLVPNAAALLFPAWVQTLRNRSERGLEMLGQRLIFVAGQLLVVGFALVPAALGALLLIFTTQWLIGLVAATALAGVAVLVILVAEVAGGLWWLGQRFERFDLSSELRP